MDLFIDIETVRQYKDWSGVPVKVQELFRKRFFSAFFQKENPDVTIEQRWNDQAGLTAEFGKIVCLAITYYDQNNDRKTRIYTGEESTVNREDGILDKFKRILLSNKCRLIGHNIKGFDIPFLVRRMMINRLVIPAPLNTYEKKPWELYGIVDTMEMWSSTEYKPFVSLDLLCLLLGVESPKEGPVTGATLGDFYWTDPVNSIKDIGTYCAGDTVAAALVYHELMSFLKPPATDAS